MIDIIELKDVGPRTFSINSYVHQPSYLSLSDNKNHS